MEFLWPWHRPQLLLLVRIYVPLPSNSVATSLPLLSWFLRERYISLIKWINIHKYSFKWINIHIQSLKYANGSRKINSEYYKHSCNVLLTSIIFWPLTDDQKCQFTQGMESQCCRYGFDQCILNKWELLTQQMIRTPVPWWHWGIPQFSEGLPDAGQLTERGKSHPNCNVMMSHRCDIILSATLFMEHTGFGPKLRAILP